MLNFSNQRGCLLQSIFIIIFIAGSLSISYAENTLSIEEFEKSSFSSSYKFNTKDSWVLREGGKYFSYSYVDPENKYSGMGLGLSGEEININRIGITWHGESNINPAKLTTVKQQMLEKLIAAVSPGLKAQEVIKYVISQQNINYPNGSNSIPKKKIGKYDIQAGHNGETLIVVISINK